MSALWVEITDTRGSAPRDAGTAMKVTTADIEGTIGGGALEFAAIEKARKMIAAGERDFAETLPLGPNLGQCCGGSVRLRYTNQPRRTDSPLPSAQKRLLQAPSGAALWLWGAGHVGRAVAAAAVPLGFAVTWVDSAAERFPVDVSPQIKVIPAADMPLLANRAEQAAHHLVFTYSHDIDLALCAALLRRKVLSCGLIGSDTKWARFQKRLRATGLDPSTITCPIGDKRLGKAPQQIAQGVVASLLTEDRMTA